MLAPKKYVDFVINPARSYVVYSKRRDELGILINDVITFDVAVQLYALEAKDVYVLGTVEEYLAATFRWSKLIARGYSDFLGFREYARRYNVKADKVERFCATALAIALGVHSIPWGASKRRYFIPEDLKPEMIEWMLTQQHKDTKDERKRVLLTRLSRKSWTLASKLYDALADPDVPFDRQYWRKAMLELKKAGVVASKGRKVKLAT